MKFTKLSQIKPNQQCDPEASDRRTDTDSEVKFLPVNTATKMMTEEVIEITSSSEAEDETRKGQKQNLGDESDDTDNTKSKENSDNLESEDSRKRSSTDRKDSSLSSSSSSSEKEKKSEEEDSSLNLGNLANLAEENCNRFLRVTSARVT